MSYPLGQCPIQCQLCERDPKVKWKCVDCDLLMCSNCKAKVHSKFKADKEHQILDLKEVGQREKEEGQQSKEAAQGKKAATLSGFKLVKISPTYMKLINIKEYPIKMLDIKFLAVSLNDIVWIGNGDKESSHIFGSYKALQSGKLVGDKFTIRNSFNLIVSDIAFTPCNDILLATSESRLKQIKAGSIYVTDSVYCEELSGLCSVHVTNEGRVIVGGITLIVVMDTNGNHLKRYEKDKNNESIFDGLICSITSTVNGNIFVIQTSIKKSVVVLGKEDIINNYVGSPSINRYGEFSPKSIVATPLDNVIVADDINHTLHILDHNGQLLTTYNTKDIRILFPTTLAITMEGPFAVLYLGCHTILGTSNSGMLYKINYTGF